MGLRTCLGSCSKAGWLQSATPWSAPLRHRPACGLAALPPCLHACPRWRWRRLGLPPTGCAQIRWIPGAVAAVVADVSQLARPLLRGALPWDRQMRIVCRRAARAQISGARGLHGQRVEQGRAEWRSLRVQFGLATPPPREQGRPERRRHGPLGRFAS